MRAEWRAIAHADAVASPGAGIRGRSISRFVTPPFARPPGPLPPPPASAPGRKYARRPAAPIGSVSGCELSEIRLRLTRRISPLSPSDARLPPFDSASAGVDVRAALPEHYRERGAAIARKKEPRRRRSGGRLVERDN